MNGRFVPALRGDTAAGAAESVAISPATSLSNVLPGAIVSVGLADMTFVSTIACVFVEGGEAAPRPEP